MFWLSALPLSGESPDNVWIALQKSTQRHEFSQNFEFKLPNSLKVGTLDSLLSLSDDLVKVNTAVEATVNKIRRQIYEIQSELPEEQRSDITVEGQKPEKYLQSFVWDEAKYPSRRPPKESVTAIMETVQKLDEDLKVKSSEYSQARASLQALVRKATGSLAVRDVSQIVPDHLIVATENITTLVAIVPKMSKDEWLSSYESLTEFVVPRSSTLVEEDGDYLAFSVLVFRRIVDDFKAAARVKGFQAKDVAGTEIEEDREDDSAQVGIASTRSEVAAAAERLKADVEKRRVILNRWCLVSYAEAFSSWIHVTAIRLFVESILRYGLPPQFLPVLIKPNLKFESQLRKVLSSNFAAVGGEHFTDGAMGGGEELFPFVSFTLSIEE